MPNITQDRIDDLADNLIALEDLSQDELEGLQAVIMTKIVELKFDKNTVMVFDTHDTVH